MFKIGILSIVILTTLLFSEDNIFYLKSYIYSSKTLGKTTSNVTYNLFLQYDKVLFNKQNKMGIFYFYMIPFFQKKDNKSFPIYKKSKKNYRLTKKKRLIQNDKYPKLKIEIYNTNENALFKLNKKIEKIKEKIFLKSNIEEKRRMDLKDSRFDNDSNTMKLGSIIERVFMSAIENQEIDFLERVFNEQDNINIVIYDLCYGEAKIDSCVDDDLYLKLNQGQLKKISSPSSSKVETKPPINASKALKTKIENYKKLNIKIENIERFKYSDSRYYLYFYESKEACNNDKEYQSKVNIKESFIADIESQTIEAQYIWLKGIGFDRCIEGSVDNKKLKFGI